MNKQIGRAIELTQRLRAVMLQAVALEKDIEEYENSEEYMQSIVGEMVEEARSLRDGRRARVLNEEDATDELTGILAGVDQLLYALMNMGGDESWNDEADYEERTQLKLGEAIKI
jgi:hypothetical protein